MMNETNTKFMCIELVWLAFALFAAIVGRVMIALDIINISHTFGVDVAICILSIIVILLFFRNKVDENSVQPIIAIFGLVMLVAFIGVMVFDSISSISQELFGVEKITEFNPHPKNAVLKFIGLGISGIIAVYGLIAFSRRAAAQEEANKLTEKGHIQERSKAEDEKLAKKRAHDQDRLKAAIDHLANPRTSGRIASFYEFLYLAKDVPDYTETILGILCAHLRHTRNAKDAKQELMESQTLIDILFSSKAKKIFSKFDYDLQRAQLPEADFRKMHKPKGKVDFSYANLSEACFDETDISGFIFREAKLHKASFREADLQKVDLFAADLSNVQLYKANLSNAYLLAAKMSEVLLVKTNFSNACLLSAQLSGASFGKTNLSGADLSDTDLSGADLFDADLSYADLRGTDLSNVEDLDLAELSGAQYGKAMERRDTRFPKGFNPEDYGMEYRPSNDADYDDDDDDDE